MGYVSTVLGVLLQLSHGPLEDMSKDFMSRNTKDAMDQFPIVTAPGASVVDIIPLCELDNIIWGVTRN